MKLIRKYFLFFVLFFLLVTFFQSCMVYKSSSVSLDTAIKTPNEYFKKLKTTEGRAFNLREIMVKENQVYGRFTKKGELKKLGISVEDIDKIRLQNKQLSNVGNAFIVVGCLGLISWVLWVTVVQPALEIDLGTFSYP